MSKISVAYDAIRAAIPAVLPSDYVELANPYFIEKDADLNFKEAWGLAFSSGFNTKRTTGDCKTISRDFVFTITRKFYITQRAIEVRIAEEKQIFEDQTLVINELEKNPDLDSAGITKILYVQDGGLEFLRGGSSTNIVMIQTIMNMEYFEINT